MNNIKQHNYKRGDVVEVKDRGEWKRAKVVDASSPYGIVVHIEGHQSALKQRANDPHIRPITE